MVAPLLGHNVIPMRVKIGLAVALSVIVGSIIPTPPSVPLVSVKAIGLIIEQLLIGMAIGLCIRMIFATVQAAGEYIGMQMGLGFATMYSAATGANSVIIARLLDTLAMLLFFAVNGHLIIIQILVNTFTELPIGQFEFNPDAWKMLVVYAKTIFSAGLLLSLPMLTALLLMNLAMGILNRSAPQLTVFSIGFPLTLLVGLVLLMILMMNLSPFMESLFYKVMIFIQKLTASMKL